MNEKSSKTLIDNQRHRIIKLGAATIAMNQIPSTFASPSLGSSSIVSNTASALLTRIIPSTKQPLPVIGMGLGKPNL